MAVRTILLLLLPLCLGACGSGEPPAGDIAHAAGAGERSGAGPAGAAARRSRDRRVAELRDALDRLDLERARALYVELPSSLGVERELLRARLAALEHDDLEAGRRIEAARRAAPDDPRVWATAAELHAAAGRLETARRELERGLERCGPTPELLRAQGIYQLVRPGGARRGLELLRAALGRDPDLPFCNRAQAQGELLLAKEALRDGDPRGALERASRSVELDPGDVEARRFLADVLAANGRLRDAAGVLRALVEEGQPLVDELALFEKRAAIEALLEHDRREALEWFAAARRHGLDEQALGTGARMLAEEAVAIYDEVAEAGEALPTDEALARLDRALRYQPDFLAARHHRAVLRYRSGDWAGAAEDWRLVLETARTEGLELPDPVALPLARALIRLGREGEARALLEEELERDPTGRFAPDLRLALDALGDALEGR